MYNIKIPDKSIDLLGIFCNYIWLLKIIKVDDYLVMCKEDGVAPETAYKGSFNVRITPQLHEKLAICAQNQGISLNKLIEKALQAYQPINAVS